MNLPPEARLRVDLEDAVRSAGEEPGPAVIDALCSHLRLMADWNPRFGLTSVSTWPEILDRHVKESLLPLRWIGQGGRLLDVGSGNGYPAIPILACRPGISAVLAERSERKSLFLEEVLRTTMLKNARVLTADLGAPGLRAPEEQFDYVISRATLAPGEYMALAARLVSPGGRVFLYAGAVEERAIGTETARPMEQLAREPIVGRRDSYLFVLQG